MSVAVGSNDFEYAVVQLENGNIERSAPKVVHGNDAVLFFIEPVSEGRGGGFIHQPQNFESGDTAGVFRGLALRVVEISGNGDDRLAHRRTEEALGIALELAQNERGNLRRRESAVTKLDANYFAGLQIVGQTKRK